MDKLTFINNQEPALNDTNLNQIQTNVENAINATKPHQVNVGTEVDENYKVNMLYAENLFNKNDILQNQYVDPATGQILSSNSRISSNYIELEANTDYVFSNATDFSTNGKGIAFYNSDKTFVSGTSFSALTNNKITTPANTSYMIFSYDNSSTQFNNIILQEGTSFIQNEININNEKYSDTINVGATEDSRSRVNVLKSNNLINPQFATTTQNGVTCTNNGDGTYTLNGTATDTCQFNLMTNLNLTGEYKLSGCPAGGSAQTYYMFARNSAWSKVIGDTGEGKIGTFDSTVAVVCIAIQNGITCNNLVFKPMITKDLSTTYADFEPYVVPSIKVDNEEIYNKGLSEYSTNEQKIGTWIDGKPLYRKVVLSTIPSGTTSTEIALGVTNISHVHRAEVRFNSIGSGDYVFNSYYSSASDYMRFFMRNNTLQIRLGVNSSGFNILAIVEYTKTTD